MPEADSVGKCIDCGYEAADFICDGCGGYVCAECVEAYEDGSYLCWYCSWDRYYREAGIADED